MMSMLLLFSLFSVGFSQQLINLSIFYGSNAINTLLVTAPYSIYISANQDSLDLLSKIYIVNEGGTKHSLKYLQYNKNTNGELKRYVIQKSSYLTTELTTDQIKTLKGVLFISSPKQVQENILRVFDIGNAQSNIWTGSAADYQTILFLNTHNDTRIYNSAYISNWQQGSNDSLAFIYPAIPTDSIEPKNTQIFSNPMQIDQIDKFFPNVQPFSLTMVAFYVKTYKGVYFEIQPGYAVDKNQHEPTTTGLYMKPLSIEDSPVSIKTTNYYTSSNSIYTGANIIGHLSNGAKVTVAEYDAFHGYRNDTFSTPPNDTIVSWWTPDIGFTLTISSTPGSTGQYYVQYFVAQDDYYPFITTTPRQKTTTTSMPTVTSTQVETTTGSGTNQILISMIISSMVFVVFY